MKTGLIRVAVLTMGVSLAACGQDVPLGSLRVLSTQTNCFEFKLMSVAGAGETQRLTFNGVGGVRHVVKIGDALGSYTVTDFQPTRERVFVASVNAWQTRVGGVATVTGRDGASIRLPLGKTVPARGWLACLVDLDGGGWRFVRQGDELAVTGGVARVVQVTNDTVRVAYAGETATVPWLTDSEQSELTALWEERRNVAEAKPQPVEVPETLKPPRESSPPLQPPPSRRAVTVRTAPRAVLGGMDYSYPTEYEVMRVPVRTASGQVTYRPIAVPTRFSRRSSGVQVEAK